MDIGRRKRAAPPTLPPLPPEVNSEGVVVLQRAHLNALHELLSYTIAALNEGGDQAALSAYVHERASTTFRRISNEATATVEASEIDALLQFHQRKP